MGPTVVARGGFSGPARFDSLSNAGQGASTAIAFEGLRPLKSLDAGGGRSKPLGAEAVGLCPPLLKAAGKVIETTRLRHPVLRPWGVPGVSFQPHWARPAQSFSGSFFVFCDSSKLFGVPPAVWD